jgi:hypothetical protein
VGVKVQNFAGKGGDYEKRKLEFSFKKESR